MAQNIRYGQAQLDDPDLNNPFHDEILLWLNEHAALVVSDLSQPEWNDLRVGAMQCEAAEGVQRLAEQTQEALHRWETEREKWYVEVDGRQISKNTGTRAVSPEELQVIDQTLKTWPGMGDPPARPDPLVQSITWQYPVQDADERLVGFVDMVITYCLPTLQFVPAASPSFIARHDSQSILAAPQQILPEWQVDWSDERTLYVDVRVAIPSLTALIRQVRLLLAHLPGKHYAIVTPDRRFTRVLCQQNIEVFPYPRSAENPTVGSDQREDTGPAEDIA